jgi:hypothetical protein
MLNKLFYFSVILVLIIFISCSSLTGSLANSLYKQKDIKLVEDGAPAYLILVEAFIDSKPNNKKMLVMGIQMFSAYSSAFVNETERSKIFADKTKTWALMLLRTYPKFKQYENAEFDDFMQWIDTLKKNDIPYVFWAANAWIMWIIANADSVEAMLDLPKAKAIIDKIYELDSSYYYGAPHLFYGIYYSVLPDYIGGDLDKAKKEFDEALKFSEDKLLMTKVYLAQYYYKAKYDKKMFINTLKEVINADIEKYPEIRLLNTIAQKQAKDLLKKVNEFFH